MTGIETDQFRYDSLESVKGQKTRHMFHNMGYSRESIVQFIDLSTQNPIRLERREKLRYPIQLLHTENRAMRSRILWDFFNKCFISFIIGVNDIFPP